jgi:hypothetical protein
MVIREVRPRCSSSRYKKGFLPKAPQSGSGKERRNISDSTCKALSTEHSAGADPTLSAGHGVRLAVVCPGVVGAPEARNFLTMPGKTVPRRRHTSQRAATSLCGALPLCRRHRNLCTVLCRWPNPPATRRVAPAHHMPSTSSSPSSSVWRTVDGA